MPLRAGALHCCPLHARARTPPPPPRWRRSAQQAGAHAFEPFYNGALLAFKVGNFQDSWEQVSRALELYPDHSDSQELLKQLKAQFTML